MAKILIVDDDDDLRDIVAEFLAAEGHEVRAARDGEDGLRLVAAGLPDAILLDVEMPKLDGPGMALQMLIRNAGSERIPIVLLSGTADLSCIASEVGTRYFLGKPVAPDVLMKMLDRALREREAPKRVAAR